MTRKTTGRPRFEPTAEQRAAVTMLAGCGVPVDRIALVTINPQTNRPIDPKTVRVAFAAELAGAHALIERAMIETIVAAARRGSVDAAKFWLRTRAGWKEPQAVELTGAGGGPVAVSTSEANATAEVRAILNQLAAEKAGGFVGLSPAGEG